MSQLSSVESPRKTAPTPGLKPALKAVLGSLDVNLDAELARYRRQKRVEQADPFSVPGTASSWSGIELPSVDNSSAANPEQAQRESKGHSALLEAEPMPQKLPDSSQNPPGLPLTYSQEAKLESKDISSVEANLESEPSTDGPDDYLESSEELLKSLDEDGTEVIPEVIPKSTQKKFRFPKSLLTPLGLGSMLLFVAASATLLYVLANPNGFGRGRVLSEKSTDSKTESKEDAKTAEAKSSATSVPKSPNLVQKEFGSVDLETLGTLEPKKSNSSSPLPEKPIGKPTPTAVVNSNSTASSGLEKIDSVLLPESVQKKNQAIAEPTAIAKPTTESNTATTTESNTATTTESNTGTTEAATKPPDEEGSSSTVPETTPLPAIPEYEYVEPLGDYLPDFYYIVMEYKNDNSLREARKWIPDAYVREFPIGVRIQLAALENEVSAKETLEELTKLGGLPAVLYKP
ncbi:MAG: hypothetical protein F6J93_01725 [Oscillatoria sp. SIO1A7]|nr:hypothetical protein [Oscillatoria sp. SIO1A7]